MPNWCRNEVVVSGDEKDVSKFINLMTNDGKNFEEGFSFNKIVPQPDNIFLDNLGEDERKECEKKNIPNWYDWNIENWDTKWDASSVFVDCIEVDYIEFDFLTAWGPPIKVIKKLKKMFPKLNVYGAYVGEGYEFAGTFDD